MNQLTKLVNTTIAATVAMSTALLIGFTGLAHADCFQYTANNFQTSQTPVFNNICGVPTLLSSTDGQYPLGNESDFVRIRPNTSGDDTVSKDNPKLTNDLTSACADGSKFDIWTYVHNDASPDFNNNGSGTAVAHDVKVALSAPLNTPKSNFSFGSTVSASNASSVSDTATLNCGGKQVTLTLVPSSVHYNNNLQQPTYTGLGDAAVNSTTGIGSPVFPANGAGGNVWGCWDYRTVIVYQVTVKTTPPPPVTPVYTCDVFNIVADVNRSVKVSTFATTATNGAVFKNVVIDWGETPPAVVSSTNPIGLTHQYSKDKDATYIITATAHFTVNGADVTAPTSPNCVKQVNFKGETPPVVVPPTTPPVTPPSTPPATPIASTPTTLVNTGPGSIALLFAITAAVGTFAHRWYMGRRLNG